MSKRKHPSSHYMHNHHPRKHSRLSNTPDEGDITAGTFDPADPSTYTPIAITETKHLVAQKLHHARKVVARALKVGRGFERQRVGKKLKAAASGKKIGGNGGDIEDIRKKLEAKLEVLHMLDLPELAHGMVAKLVKKHKRITASVFWPGDEQAGVVGTVGAGVVIRAGKGEKEIEGVDMAVVKSNVVAMLCNTRPVREAMKSVLEGLLTVTELGGEDGEKVGKGKSGGKKEERVEQDEEDEEGQGGNGNEDREQEENEDEEDSKSEGDDEEWGGILTNSDNDDSKATKMMKPQNEKTTISAIDPSRREDEEWSGDEDEDWDDDDFLHQEIEEDREVEDADQEEEVISESELIARFDKFIAPASDKEDNVEGDESHSSSSSSSHSESPPLSCPTKKTKPSKPSPSPPNPPLKTHKPTSSTFLPTLMSGYISPSPASDDSDLDNPDAAYYSHLRKQKNRKGPPVKKERKNRMGQQARRALAEKKFGESARHVKLGLGPAKMPGRERRGRGRERGERSGGGSGEGRERGGRGGGNGGRGGGGEGEGEGGRERKRNGLGEGQLHPSWEAARKAKEAKANALQKFQGKKIKFDD